MEVDFLFLSVLLRLPLPLSPHLLSPLECERVKSAFVSLSQSHESNRRPAPLLLLLRAQSLQRSESIDRESEREKNGSFPLFLQVLLAPLLPTSPACLPT